MKATCIKLKRLVGVSSLLFTNYRNVKKNSIASKYVGVTDQQWLLCVNLPVFLSWYLDLTLPQTFAREVEERRQGKEGF